MDIHSPESLIREAKRITLSAMHSVQAKTDEMRIKPLLERFDPKPLKTNLLPARKSEDTPRSILFVVTRFVRFAGGQTSILRLGTELSKLGFKVYYAVYKKQSREEMRICVSSLLPDYRGTLVTAPELKRMYRRVDIAVASSWDTVSEVKKFFGYKMYFVQDYEPYFYMYGEQSLMAQKTYEMGLHMVSLGGWNRDEINKHCRVISPVDTVSFPYEAREYSGEERDFSSYTEKKEIVLAVYLKFYGKRFPSLIPWLLEGLSKRLASDGKTLRVYYFGEAKSFKISGGENLGMLNREQLADLYKRADFGMVASYSNISLVPYEMLASGLPVIEFEDGTFKYFFKSDSALLTEINPDDLYIKLKSCLNNPDIIKQRMENAKSEMAPLSWANTARQFKDIIEGTDCNK